MRLLVLIALGFLGLPAYAQTSTDEPAPTETKVTPLPAATSISLELAPTVDKVCGIVVVRGHRGEDAIRVAKDHCVAVDRGSGNN